jgi:hypothetical protein
MNNFKGKDSINHSVINYRLADSEDALPEADIIVRAPKKGMK